MSNWNRNGRYHGGFPTTIRRQAEHALPKHCNHCHRTDTRLWLDHITPAAEGGTNTIDNAAELVRWKRGQGALPTLTRPLTHSLR